MGQNLACTGLRVIHVAYDEHISRKTLLFMLTLTPSVLPLPK